MHRIGIDAVHWLLRGYNTKYDHSKNDVFSGFFVNQQKKSKKMKKKLDNRKTLCYNNKAGYGEHKPNR